MTSIEMLREFRVGIDKIDSSSYPEIYDEQIFMFINRAINELVNAGRKIFEENQLITDNLKSLIPKRPVRLIPTIDPDDPMRYEFDLLDAEGYMFYIRSSATTRIDSDTTGKASVKVTQHDDIEVVLTDPYNKPKPYKIPITFSRDSIVGYSDGRFSIISLDLTYVKKPAIVDYTTNCDIDEQLHYTIVESAIQIAIDNLGINKQELNK